jgi:hypothetical protein
MAIGYVDAAPTSGSFYLGYDGVSTVGIPFNATSNVVATALNNVSTIISAGGVTVEKVGNQYRIQFVNVGEREDIVWASDTLLPSSTVRTTVLSAGTADQRSLQLIKLVSQPFAFQDTFTNIPPATATLLIVTPYANGAVTYNLEWSSTANAGFITLAVDGDNYNVPFNATASTFQGFGFVASQVGINSFDFIIEAETAPSVSINDDSLYGIQGRRGIINLNTAEIESFFTSAANITADLELEITEEDVKQTVVQQPIVIQADLINGSEFVPVSLSTPATEAQLSAALTGVEGLIAELTESDADINARIDDLPIDAITDASHKSYRSQATGTNSFTYIDENEQESGLSVTMFSPPSYIYDGWTVSFTSQFSIGYTETNAVLKTLKLGTSSSNSSMKDVTDYYSAVGGLPAGWGVEFSSEGNDAVFSNNFEVDIVVNSPVVTVASGANVSLAGGVFDELSSDAKANSETNRLLGTDSQGNATWLPPVTSLLAGGTFTGKVNFTSVSESAGLNIGIGGSPTGATVSGDIWIPTAGTNINFRDGNGIHRVCATTTTGNTFSQPQTIFTPTTATQAALRVENRGTGPSLVIEDKVSVDTTSLVVDPDGNVGIGVASGYTSTSKLEVVGNVKSTTLSTGSGPTFSFNSTAAHTGGADTLDLLVSINGANYRIALRPA